MPPVARRFLRPKLTLLAKRGNTACRFFVDFKAGGKAAKKSYRLKERVEDLKARIAKMKAK